MSRGRSFRCAILLGTTLMLGACKHGAQGSSSDSTAAGPLVAALERGACRGTCPVYRVEVYGDGRVRFEGRDHVAHLGLQTSNVPTVAVRELVEAIQASQFAVADTAYVMNSASCGQYATDLPVSTLSARVGSRVKRVERDPGCRNAPTFLRALEAKVDSVAGSARWVSGTGSGGR